MAIDPKGKDTRAMPAGDERKDQVKANTDALAEKAEADFANQDSIDPKKMEIDREAAAALGGNSRDPREVGRARVRNMQPGMDYLWVFEGADSIAEAENRFADLLPMSELDYDGHTWHGWQLVQGKDPEAKDRMDVRGYRKLIDALLFRAPLVIVEKWQRARDIQNQARQMGVGEGLMANADMVARRHNVDPRYVIALAGNLEPGELRRLGRQNLREMAQKDAIIRDLRAGTVPHMEVARK